jgi:SpoVK/Ycf46/Vps4 family AAA+-type ATPase
MLSFIDSSRVLRILCYRLQRLTVAKILKNEKLSPNCHPMTLAEITQGYSGSDLKELCKVAAQIALRDYLRQEEEYRQRKMVLLFGPRKRGKSGEE